MYSLLLLFLVWPTNNHVPNGIPLRYGLSLPLTPRISFSERTFLTITDIVSIITITVITKRGTSFGSTCMSPPIGRYETLAHINSPLCPADHKAMLELR